MAESLLESLKRRYPELKWQIIIGAIKHCNLCNHQACPEVVRIPQIEPHPDEIKAQKLPPVTPPALLACCSECGAFWCVI